MTNSAEIAAKKLNRLNNRTQRRFSCSCTYEPVRKLLLARRSKSLNNLLTHIDLKSMTRTCNQLGEPNTIPTILTEKKFSLPVCINSDATAANAPVMDTKTIRAAPIAMMSSATKFSTSEAETIVMAASSNANNLSSSNLRNSFFQQLSHSPTIVNTGGMLPFVIL